MNKDFHIKKNILDNEYNRTLSQIQIITVGIITATVATSILFLQTEGILSSVGVVLLGGTIILLSMIPFKKKLDKITTEISSLRLL